MTASLQAGRPPDGSLGFLHVDMDAFFASVELLRRPELRKRPVVVGGTGSRGVVAAASYIARAYGVRSAMPTVQARRLCPEAVFIAGDHARYAEVSGRLMALFGDVTPLVEPLSLDEAFLDVRGALHGEDKAADIAHELRRRVHSETGLTCSVGVAANKFLAKLATDWAKPRPSLKGPVFGPGVHVIPVGCELGFLHPLDVRKLWGVGPATASRLSQIGVETVGDLASQPLARLAKSLGEASARHLHRLANGIDERPVEPQRELKSVGHEETFPSDLFDRELLANRLVRMADAVAARLRAGDLAGRTVTLKTRFADFVTVTRSVTLRQPVDNAGAIADAACGLLAGLLDSAVDERGIRLLGVSVSRLGERTAEQLSFDDLDKRSEIDEAVDEIRSRFGDDAVGPASLVRPGAGIDRITTRGQKWGPDDEG